MKFKEFLYNELLNSPTAIHWEHRLIDDGKPKRATFDVNGWWYWVSFTGPNELSVNPTNLGNINGKPEYFYCAQFDVFRDSEGEPVKNNLMSKVKMITKPSADDSFNFTSTKLGDERQVFSSVMEAVKEFLTTVKPAILGWKGRSQKLSRIYQMVANRSTMSGYSFSPNPYGGNRLIRDDVKDDVLAIEKQPHKEAEPNIMSRMINKVTLNNPVLAAQGWPYRHGDIKSLT